jgi:hypothetical protein
VDPFQRKVHEIQVGNHIRDWYRWCDCDCFDHVTLGELNGQVQDLWVDDEGLLREPQYPMWKWEDYSNPLCGYGLINASDGPETIATIMPVRFAEEKIDWEPWEHRIDPANYFDQLSRLYLQTGIGKTETHT